MAARRSSTSFAPTCLIFESRLAPSGNFLSHGFAAISREADRLEHHHHAEHSVSSQAVASGDQLQVHYHHINAAAATK